METEKWWKDKRLLIGVIFVVVSFLLGTYGKIVIITKIYEPINWITGLSIWAFSWIVLYIGAFLIGWGTIKIIKDRIRNRVKKTIKGTYQRARALTEKKRTR